MNPFSLSSILVQGQLLHNRAEVQLTQKYRNQSSENLEFNYTFPVPHDAQVHSFTMKMGDKVVRSEIMETEEAYEVYDETIAKGDSAAIVESIKKDILELSAGNIAPGETVTIELHYLQELPWEDEGQSLRWQIPTVVAPRYTSDPGPEDFRRQPYIALNETKLQMDLDLFMLSPIHQISSPSHPISVSIQTHSASGEKDTPNSEHHQAHVSLAKTNEIPDSDIILHVSLMDVASTESASMLTSPDKKFSLIQIHPDLENYAQEDKARMYVFILDRSGSMDGIKLEQAKVSLKLCLRQLSEKDRFMLVAFNDQFSFLSHRPIQFHDINLEKADQWIDEIYASGGTEIYKPLEYILQKLHPTKGNIILLFTDGQVMDEDNILKLVKAHEKDVQLYPFGIDTAVNKAFLDALATAGNGLAEYIYPGEMIDDKVLRQFSRIHSPYYEDVKFMDQKGQELEVFPPPPKKFFSGELYQFLLQHPKETPASSLDFCFQLQGKTDSMPIIEKSSAEGVDKLSSWWALEKIRFLESTIQHYPPSRNDFLEKEIVEISMKYGVLSQFTSLVAVMPREHPLKGLPKFVKIPVCPPRNWNMDMHCEGTSLYDMGTTVLKCSAPPMRRMRNGKKLDSFEVFSNFAKVPVDVFQNSTHSADYASQQIADSMGTLGIAIQNVALMQNADGSVGKNPDKTKATALFVLGFLQSGNAVKKYRIAIQKALKWLVENAQSHYLLVSCALHEGRVRKLLHSKDTVKTGEYTKNLTIEEQELYEQVSTGTTMSLWKFLYPSIEIDENNTADLVARVLKEIETCSP
jgi:Ca-activated chloride channel family protein